MALFLNGATILTEPKSRSLDNSEQPESSVKISFALEKSSSYSEYVYFGSASIGARTSQSVYASSNSSLVVVVSDNLTWAPLAGVVVASYIQPLGQAQLYGVTNSSGVISFPNITEGDYRLVVSMNLYFNGTLDINIMGPGSFIEIVKLDPIRFGDLVVRVVDSDGGNGLVGTHVVSTSQPSHQQALSDTTGTLGYVFFNDILVGNYALVISIGGYLDVTVSATISENTTTSRAVPLTRSLSLSMQIIILLPVGLAFIFVILIPFVFVRRRRSQPSAGRALVRNTNELHTSRNVADAEERSRLLTSSLGSCPYCVSSIRIDDAEFCWNCGGSLTATNVVLGQGGKQERVVEGHCMVCNLRVKPGDSVVWCPYCGNVAHRTHMLEWLHVKDYCPVCRNHLDAEELRK